VACSRHHDAVQQFNRIAMDPDVMVGKLCIRGMRVTAGMLVEAMSAGRTIEQLLCDFPYTSPSPRALPKGTRSDSRVRLSVTTPAYAGLAG
jgi:uncharacterized protein (DUF433 family)